VKIFFFLVDGGIFTQSVGEQIETYNTASRLKDPNTSDLGITILLYHFARYHNRGRYAHFVLKFETLLELDDIEASFSNTRKLPIDLGYHEKYGLFAMRDVFNTGKRTIRILQFKLIMATIQQARITPEIFVEMIKDFHPNIIQSLYSLAISTRDTRMIKEVNVSSFSSRVKFYKRDIFDAEYWCVVPNDARWFLYDKGQCYCSGYLNRKEKLIIKKKISDHHLDAKAVYGFINSDETIIFSHLQEGNNWTDILKKSAHFGLNPPFRSRQDIVVDIMVLKRRYKQQKQQICFVREEILNTMYKFV
jgi:hypothetical protein